MTYTLAEIQNNDVITFDYSNNDMINPTVIKTPYSKSIILPFTKKNNELFGYYFKTDKIITLNDVNPNLRIPYQIRYNGETIQSGYLQLTNITKDGYELILFSDIGGMFRDMGDVNLNTIIPYVPLTINKSRVHQLMNTVPADATADPVGSMRYLWWYTMQPTYKGLYDNFVSTKLEKDNGNVIEIEEANEHQQRELRSYKQTPGIWYNKLISSIANEYGIYLDSDFHNNTNPYWSKTTVLFPNIFANKVNDTSGVISQPDTLRYEHTGHQGTQNNVLIQSSGTTETILTETEDPYNIIINNTIDLSNFPKGQIEVEYQFDIKIKGYCSWDTAMATWDANMPNTPGYLLGPYVKDYNGPKNIPDNQFKSCNVVISSWIDNQINKHNEDYFAIKDFNNQNMQDTFPSIIFETPTRGNSNFYNYNIWEYAKFCSAGNYSSYINTPKTDTYTVKGKSIINNNGTPQKLRVSIGYKSYDGSEITHGGIFRSISGYVNINVVNPDIRFKFEMENLSTNVFNINTPSQIRSNYVIDASNIIPNTLKVSDVFINHLKMFGLVLYEHPEHGLTVSMRDTWYNMYNGEIIDWNTKECNEKDYVIEPLNYTSKIYTFNHKEFQCSHIDDYKSRFGEDINYGSQQIDTGYQFSDKEATSLFDSIYNQPLTSQEYGIYTYNNVNNFFRYDQILPCLATLTEEGKMNKASFNQTIFFRDGNVTTPDYQSNYPNSLSEPMPNWYVITDDTPNMTLNQEFYWCYDWRTANGATTTNNASKIKLTYTGSNLVGYPYCQTLNKNKTHSLDWGKPQQAYYSISDNNYPPNSTLYQRFYSKWIEDRYNINTKTYEGYFMLNQNDINQIKFNKFIYFKNQYWCIDKISEYKYGATEPTKVKLVKINNINNYVSGQTIQ